MEKPPTIKASQATRFHTTGPYFIKQLRPYQVTLVTDVCRATEDVLVEQPTGSGKTVQIVTLVAMHLGRRFTHAVISASTRRIMPRPMVSGSSSRCGGSAAANCSSSRPRLIAATAGPLV
jgi:ERCC4-related helicase